MYIYDVTFKRNNDVLPLSIPITLYNSLYLYSSLYNSVDPYNSLCNSLYTMPNISISVYCLMVDLMESLYL